MAIIAIDSGRLLRDAALNSAASRRGLRQRDSQLDQLRTDIYQSGTVARDYLLELNDSRAEVYKSELERVRGRINDTLRAYGQEIPDSERVAFEALREDVASYWKSLDPCLSWNAATRRQQGQTFLRDVVVPHREEVVQVAKRATAINDRDLDAVEERLQSMQSHIRQRVAVVSLVALIVGGILAGIIIRRLQRLEAQADLRFREVEEARQELRNLSNRLVTTQEEERRNLSRELHDEIGQSLSAMLVELGRLETSPVDSDVGRERLASARRMAEECVRMVRDMALLLRPSMLDDLGLIPALRWQAREVTRRTGLKVKMVADEIVEDLLDSHRTCIYRFVQEALNNCGRHSHASQVRVIVRQDREGLIVSVQDDGIGFDPRQEKGMGLLGMEERVERLGGLFHIESQPGHGAVLSIRFTLAACRSVPEKKSA